MSSVPATQILTDKIAAGVRTNWSGNHTYRASSLLEPRTLAELQEIVVASPRVRALGSRHSFNSIADCENGVQLSLEHLREIALEPATSSVTVSASVRYGELAATLDGAGFALHNLASLPHISVAGACATGTHGSGVGNGNLATAVTALELVTATGEVRRITQGDELFNASVVSLGMLGIVSRLTLRVEPSYMVRQLVYEGMQLPELVENLQDVLASAYSVSIFTGWQPGQAAQVWRKERCKGDSPAPPATFYGGHPTQREMHPLPDHSPENCTPQLGIPGPWHERLPHFRTEFTPSSGNELQTEYFVAFEDGPAAVCAVTAIGEQITPLLLISELRAVAGDELWISPAYRRFSLALHFTWRPEWDAVQQVLPSLEAALAPFAARPHWGKVFTMQPETVRDVYTRLPEFAELTRELDPHGKFRNGFASRYVTGVL